ncbi:hypothetical protein JTB14_036941 [Gonioctena quinquepunctata]|nr:hypothetical protein JTB14_036941 [Gonioctena quinquepunctata]
MCYRTARRTSIDESMILFKERISLKQYNPMKPIKRGYKLWCQIYQNAFVSDFGLYQGKLEISKELRDYGLGERVVLSMTKFDWDKFKIIYADNYFMSIFLLEKLRMENTLACGIIECKRKAFSTNMKDDKSMARGDFDYRISNTDIRVFKWRGNRVVHFASNFHSTENITVKRTQNDGSPIDIECPSVVRDFNEHMC